MEQPAALVVRMLLQKESRESESWQGSIHRLSWRTSLLRERKEQGGLFFLEFTKYAQGRDKGLQFNSKHIS